MTFRAPCLASIFLFGLALLCCEGKALPQASAFSPKIESARLTEPLYPTGPTTQIEDQALASALEAYETRQNQDDPKSLIDFLANYPTSNWSAAVHTNLGYFYLQRGYFTRAITAWKEAWANGKSASEPHSVSMVDGAVGQLAHLYASLGRMDELASLLDEVKSRPISGSATESIQTAQEVLTLSKKDPRHLFHCGPTALKLLLLSDGVQYEKANFLQWYRASAEGTSLAELSKLADRGSYAHDLIFRSADQPVPVPSLVHWKLGHYATILREQHGRYEISDPAFAGRILWVTKAALDDEGSGYFLIPKREAIEKGWRLVEEEEAKTVRGKGPTDQTRPGGGGDGGAGGGPGGGCPLCGYDIKEATVSLTLSDTPVGYTPAFGPSAKTVISYNQREDSQPQNFNFFNVSPKWTLNWLSYVTDDPTNAGANVSRYIQGGTAFYYSGYNISTGQFAAEDISGSILTFQAPASYKLTQRDGSYQIYSASDGSTSYPRRVFLTKSSDAQGNALSFNYDAQQRLTSIVDAVGRTTNFSYEITAQPLLVTKITDPFNRSAALTYDSSGRLASITDIIGLKSRFTYDGNSLVNFLATPYGTTSFSYTAPGTSGPPRFVQVNDPLGYHEREEWLEPSPIPNIDPAATVPQGMPLAPANDNLVYRNSFFWNKDAYTAAGCTPTGGCDYSKARIKHFLHMANSSIKSTTVESIKYPLENRIWYNYPGQNSSIFTGSYNQPIAVGRVLDDSTTQLTQNTYDPVNFNLTQTIDPLGRATSYTYAANNIDLLAVAQASQNSTFTSLAQFTYDARHRPVSFTDTSSQTSFYAYNSNGQLLSSTDALGEKTQYQYDLSGNLITIINANGNTAASFTYDSFARVRTATDSEGWMVTYDYDAADRITKITYPDATFDLYSYDKLDLAYYQDRQGRRWTYTHDANRRLTKIVDPMGQQTLLGYNGIGSLTSLTDPKGNITTWAYDVQGRLTSKQYADTSTVTYTYETTTSRLKSILDALGQTKQYTYAKDDRPTGISYLNAVNPTSNVSFTYDPYFPLLASMTDGTGTTQYTYGDALALGTLMLKQECQTPTGATACASQIDYAYDPLGRLSTRTVSGAGPESFQYDALGRLSNHASDLGSFAMSYLGQTNQITQRQLLPVSSNLTTTWSYLPNSGDRRLSAINNTGLSTSQFTNFQFTTTPENFISAIAQTSDASILTPGSTSQTATYNNLNQLTSLSGQALTYDANGNLLSDGQRNYSWDAENRLIGITYPAQSGKTTAFVYDGLSRRTVISSTPIGGGSTTTTSYIWCGTGICQARDSFGTTIREYFPEGEFIPGSAAQPYYYGVDQIGSMRRAFTSTSSAAAFDYDAWGNKLQPQASLTDFNYAGMLLNTDSNLYLTQYRAYDPFDGHWSSRDPFGNVMQDLSREKISTFLSNSPFSTKVRGDSNYTPRNINRESFASIKDIVLSSKMLIQSNTNLYNYANNSPITNVDTNGLAPFSYSPVPNTNNFNICGKKKRDCYDECKHLLPSPSGDLQSSEFSRCYRLCSGSLFE